MFEQTDSKLQLSTHFTQISSTQSSCLTNEHGKASSY